MNDDLNSILLEGTLLKDPEFSRDENGKAQCLLIMSSDRFFRRGNDFEKRTTTVQINAEGNMADQCKQGHQGRKLRIVGSLMQYWWKNDEGKNLAQIGIDAAHIEFKPEFTQKVNKEKSYDGYER